MRRLVETVRRVAPTTAGVLITGESGVGKEVIARAIHHFSLRCSKPWVDISCAALPETLIESELFGHEKGAFSGAEAIKHGLFELANGGTLFLDEIGELPPKMQVKLLRVLDNVPYYRLGGTRKVTADVRIVASTNRNLEVAMHRGDFRRDLYHRLNQVQLTVPPIRERVEEIEPMAQFFLERENPDLRFSLDAIEALSRYSWPGNVRELRNVVLSSSLAAEDGVVDLPHLPPVIQCRAVEAEPLKQAAKLEQAERHTIMRVLSETGGHQRRAAELLGISRRTLIRKLKFYEFEPGNTEPEYVQ